MKPKLRTLTIERFRTFRHLRIEDLGRVNLITGRNNTGKSSLLEALRIVASGASPYEITQILQSREENFDLPGGMATTIDDEDIPMITHLFSGFPSPHETYKPIEIMAEISGHSHRLSLSIEKVTELRDPDGATRYITPPKGSDYDPELQLALIVEAETGRRPMPLKKFKNYSSRSYDGDRLKEQVLPCIFVNPYGKGRASALGALWDRIALSELEKDVVKALNIISPDIEAVSMIGGEGPRKSRIAVVRSRTLSRRVPLGSYGDGLNRIFGIILSLVNARDGLLLIDEVENGIHYSVQLELWRAIFQLSKRLDLQVFATSHSWDSVESFQKVAGEEPESGALIRLTRKGDDIIPVLFREEELAVATRDRIEVR